MKSWQLVAGCAMLAGLLLAASPQVLEYPTPLAREDQPITINGVPEVWQLRWKSAPKPVCEPSDVSLTMPCVGFAYGEGGDLELVRMRERMVFDRLAITPLFEELFTGTGAVAIVQRWAADFEHDFDAANAPDFAQKVSRRPIVQVMHFADYDHDGQATEFYLQTEAMAGHTWGSVIGISKTNPHLHVFGTASHPDQPLHLQQEEWEALRSAAAPVEVVDWPCGDHGADEHETVQLRWTAKGIDGTRRNYACGLDGKPGKLISEEPL